MATSTQTHVIPELKHGDHLSLAEFERRYHAASHIKKAELIEGVVDVASPVSKRHSKPHGTLVSWVSFYLLGTPNVDLEIDGTIRLDDENQFQPDLQLLLPPNLGGQTTTSADGYVVGCPELVAEVSVTTTVRDLGAKLEAYRRHGAREYLVWRVLDRAIDWFILRDGKYERLEPDADGLLKSEVFPGLWLDPAALIRGDFEALSAAVQQGLASAEYQAFVQRLVGGGA